MSTTIEIRPVQAPNFPRTDWDSRLFIVHGDDRPNLIERVRELAASPEARNDFVETAAMLAAALAPGGSRLAVIAADGSDLRKKLLRAADRLADQTCKQIRDSAGVYFFENTLADQGTLAVLFPGEGAQNADMLLDLCGIFPEVEETFAQCDQIARDAGRPQDSLRRVLHLPADATTGERAVAESKLRQLGPSIFGVLVADQAIFRILQNLRLPVAATAGHSAGELGALLASGAIRNETDYGSRLAEIMDLMQALEEDAGGPDVTLLAVGAGRALVAAAATSVAGGEVIVAMDNCPHQCVAVGPTPQIAKVEASLQERGVLFERLPFRRPYHTPQFDPWMGPFRELFSTIRFDPPHTPVYSATTGEKFPSDPDAARDLTVNHWASRVEFTKMIETMYADGVRIFVESGPRGNLSAFVEDILRGLPFAAIPANVARKTGPTQINHMVGQLVAHDVPVNVGHLFGGATSLTTQPASPRWTQELNTDGGAVLHNYFELMEQFLNVQCEVMTAYFAGRPAGEAFDFSPPTPEVPFALVGTIEHFERDREVVFRRVMDEAEDLYAADHTLGGRAVSRADPMQNGLPVLPMTFSLEAMCEAALLLAPGKVVVAIRDVRLYRWLPFDPEPTTLEVRASVLSADPASGEIKVKADVRDLGNSFIRDGASKVASEAVVVLADHYPDPPERLPFQLTDEKDCACSVDELRRNMFHGPVFQMIRKLGRHGKEGIEGTLEVQPRDSWFRSDADPHVAIDPVLMDAAMHILGAWHLEQPDWTGRILLPFEVQRVEFFGPTPGVASHLVVRGHNEQESPRHYRHGLEVFTQNGRPWLRLTGAAYWRFYLPFGHVNFFGPKDEYFLSRNWPEAVPPRRQGAGGAHADSPRRCHFLEPPADLLQPVLRAAGARVTMTPRELAEFRAWAGSDAGLNDWFFGRLLAKDAVRAAWAERHGEALFPADIEVEVDAGGRFVARPRGTPGPEPLPSVAVATARGTIAAFAAFAPRVGISLLEVGAGDEADASGRAAAAAVRDALRDPQAHCTIIAVDRETGRVAVALTPATAARYPEFPIRPRVQTARNDGLVVATTLGEAEST
jgi:malonyl CoA-acyl carrier protein transacylase